MLVTHVNRQKSRVTQVDIAVRAGVHRTTVSLALQNHPKIPLKTRELIHRIAEELGYTPDPMLSALVAYRNQTQPRAFQGTLAWLGNSIPPYDWKEIPIFYNYYLGAVACAKSYGYGIEVFDMQVQNLTAKRLAGIMLSRNISGVLVAPQPHPDMDLQFEWEHFSAITFGYSLRNPQLHCITSTQYRATLKTIEQLRAYGYSRIGFATTRVQDSRINHNSLAAYLVDMRLNGEAERIFPMQDGVRTAAVMRRWIAKEAPDCLIVSEDIYDMMLRWGIRVPEEIPVACPMLSRSNRSLSGVYENSMQVGEMAVDFLIAMVRRGEKGVPEVSQRVMVDGKWMDGESLPVVRKQQKR